ncbi:flagellar basal body P-ring formation chaperone FlgA [Desulfoluna sp.]|uniref:flagellar basal body P-ring formation chaperone FlgA n=1 Tax=Desulfoluna sp. TaxID=2045199 RepID=UPI0026193EBF|nr:flagellar basal body P-ring formation chaperone FlgA [Desulfoluna sp.]
MILNNAPYKFSITGSRPMPGCLWMVILLWLLPGILHAENAPAMRPRVEVTRATVRVADLFSCPLPVALRPHADTPVMNAPLPGKERFVPGAFLVRKLSLLAGVNALTINTPHRICVFRKGQTLTDKHLVPFLESLARATWKEPVSITGFRVTGRRTLPLGTLSFTPDKKRARIRKNRVELPVAVFVNGKTMGRITLSGKASVLKNVVITHTALRQGEKLTSAHITLALRPVPPSDHDILTDPIQAIGRMATRPIGSGTLLTTTLVKASPLVQRGDGVRIRYTLGGLLITATGIARETGGRGDFIKVKNSRSGKIIPCRITGACRVEPFL